ncbi:unnamed protein product, partial [Amoebophrya sp. A25]
SHEKHHLRLDIEPSSDNAVSHRISSRRRDETSNMACPGPAHREEQSQTLYRTDSGFSEMFPCS